MYVCVERGGEKKKGGGGGEVTGTGGRSALYEQSVWRQWPHRDTSTERREREICLAVGMCMCMCMCVCVRRRAAEGGGIQTV